MRGQGTMVLAELKDCVEEVFEQEQNDRKGGGWEMSGLETGENDDLSQGVTCSWVAVVETTE